MASTPKQVNGNGSSSLGKRKKSRESRSTYLSKWLDKTMHHAQEAAPSVENYDFINPTMNWPIGGSQFAPGYDPYRHIYGAPEPLSLPTLPSYYSPSMIPQGLPIYHNNRYVPNVTAPLQRHRMRRRNSQRAEELRSTQTCLDDSLQPKNLSDQDYASLPPIITSVGDTNSNSDMNDKDKDDGSNARRYSDPCVRGLPDVARPANGDVDSESDESSSASGSQVGSRLLSCLLDQIASLKIANDRLNKDLLDTRAELESTRQHNVILHKGPGSSIGATPNHSLDNGLHSGQYSPGFLTDLVREIRDAARIREEAMYTRVKAMVLERTDNLASTEAKLTEKTLEEIKSSLRASEADKRRMLDRINKLEDEMHALRHTSGSETNDNKLTNGIIEDSEADRMRLRKELADARRARQSAEENVHKLERLVTHLRSKLNGLNTNGPESLPSDPEHDTNARIRRASLNSSNNSTVVFGPVTDL